MAQLQADRVANTTRGLCKEARLLAIAHSGPSISPQDVWMHLKGFSKQFGEIVFIEIHVGQRLTILGLILTRGISAPTLDDGRPRGAPFGEIGAFPCRVLAPNFVYLAPAMARPMHTEFTGAYVVECFHFHLLFLCRPGVWRRKLVAKMGH